MREIFVTQLVKEILGPKFGIEELSRKNPLNEYITGVLSPIITSQSQTITSDSVDNESTIPVEDLQNKFEDDNDDIDIDLPPMFSPALDPKNRPPSIGISFIVHSIQNPAIDVCITWARYFAKDKSNGPWKRNPRFTIKHIRLDQNRSIYVDSDGNESTEEKAEIKLYILIRTKKNEDNKFIITIYLENKIKIGINEIPSADCYIFQPQIRIVTSPNTQITEGLRITAQNPEESILELLYKKRPVFARGHLCSAMWNEIDPEIQNISKFHPDFPDCCNELPFRWQDGDIIPEKEKVKFSNATVRTEFVPAYAMSMPNLGWRGEYGEPPELFAAKLAELYDSSLLNKALLPIINSYEKWIYEIESQSQLLPQKEKIVSKKIIDECKLVLQRIRSGINILLNDDDARICFCFANKAMDIQARWSPRKTGLEWHPFQMAFILSCIESIVNPESKFRNTCDLLWVPTGAGKTEAYLGVIAFTFSYRRRKSIKNSINDRTGAGVSVITRYTLRLLTIQQFRRSLALVTACEYLRTFNLIPYDLKLVGWRPVSYSSDENFIWGSTQFSIGLWVGNDVTPNKLETIWTKNEFGTSSKILGALDILQTNGHNNQNLGEPAQILNCPACGTILAIPEMGLQPGIHELHIVIKNEDKRIESLTEKIQGMTYGNLEIIACRITSNSNNYFTFSLTIKHDENLLIRDIDEFWDQLSLILKNEKCIIECASSKASRPGYFLRYYINQNRRKEYFDFEIFCPNPHTDNQIRCFLHQNWCAGKPFGWIHGIEPDPNATTKQDINLYEFPDGNTFIHIQHPFQKNNNKFISDRIPIPALTVDDQLYHRLPTMIVATVDKFARPSFEARASGLFGNVAYYHCIHGYYRDFQHSQSDSNGHPNPIGRRIRNYRTIRDLKEPDLILQDELHLIEGPLGSLTGLYETALDTLCSRKYPVKYIASTATIKRAEEQINAIFARKIQLFPPQGISIEDRFFIKESPTNVIDDTYAGRLYIGICAPGRGPLTPIIRIWSRLLQTAYENRKMSQKIDRFWTLTGYFNAVRELAGARALYRQDIPQRMHDMAGESYSRPLADENAIELSSRRKTTDLPSILDTLSNRKYPDSKAADALLTTSMFGTGVDISRIGLMVVNGQPKTTSAYIQSTGRVGRSFGGLVVTFYRASRPRDLSHYEFFCGYHHQIHRFVEPVTVYPFAPGVLDRALGPVGVFILRNKKNNQIRWDRDGSATEMGSQRSMCNEVNELPSLFENRSLYQPKIRKPILSVENEMHRKLDLWHSIARTRTDLRYVEYAISELPKYSVVLGDSQHSHFDELDIVYENAPQSLRDVEETTGFQT